MTRYLISFDDGAMTFPDEDLPDVAKAAHEVVEQAKDAGVWVFGGGVKGYEASVVATDGSVTDGSALASKEGAVALGTSKQSPRCGGAVQMARESSVKIASSRWPGSVSKPSS